VEENRLHPGGRFGKNQDDEGVDQSHQNRSTPSAQYIGKYARLFGEYNYLWDSWRRPHGSIPA